MNCRVGRVLRRLEVGEVVQEGDGWFDFRDKRWFAANLTVGSDVTDPDMYRPLTPEEVEDYKRRMENYCAKHNEYFTRYCRGCRTAAGLKHFDKVRAEVTK